MITAKLVAENVSWQCPVTNMYETSDGRFLLVTFPQIDVLGSLAAIEGMPEAMKELGLTPTVMSRSQLQSMPTVVYLANADGQVVDADGDLSNGMTSLYEAPPGTSVQDALAAAGYSLEG